MQLRKRGYRLLRAVVVLILCATGWAAFISYRNTIVPAGIVVHHSAIPLPINKAADLDIISELHRKRGFSVFYWGKVYDIGYHYIILPDGTVVAGRPEHCLGAHATGYNSYIGICLIGNFSSEDNPTGARGAKEPTAAQMRALNELTTQLRSRYGIPLDRVVKHHDVDPKADCPGDRFPSSQLLGQLRE